MLSLAREALNGLYARRGETRTLDSVEQLLRIIKIDFLS
jgi:hypothetical protein